MKAAGLPGNVIRTVLHVTPTTKPVSQAISKTEPTDVHATAPWTVVLRAGRTTRHLQKFPPEILCGLGSWMADCPPGESAICLGIHHLTVSVQVRMQDSGARDCVGSVRPLAGAKHAIPEWWRAQNRHLPASQATPPPKAEAATDDVSPRTEIKPTGEPAAVVPHNGISGFLISAEGRLRRIDGQR